MSLLNLPNELLLDIAEYLELSENFLPEDLYGLLRANRRLAYLLTPLLAEEAAEDKDGLTAIQWAIVKNNLSLLKLLLKYRRNLLERDPKGTLKNITSIYPDLSDYQQCSTLQIAIRTENTQMTKLLLENGADSSFVDSCGETALHYAAMGEGDETMTLVLLNHGVDLTARDYYGRTALHEAAASGRPEVVKHLIENGADVMAANKHGVCTLNQVIFCRMGNYRWDASRPPENYEMIVKLILDASGHVYDQETIERLLRWAKRYRSNTDYWVEATWEGISTAIRKEIHEEKRKEKRKEKRRKILRGILSPYYLIFSR